jgi:aspartate/methionine/tyrosine aminotransferase
MALKVSRRGSVPPFIVMDVLRAANQREAAGADVFHLEVGQPGTPAPRGVIEAAREALESDRLGYTEAFGLPRLRERIAEHYRTAYGVSVSPDQVVVTTGSSGGFVVSFLAAFDPGDRVALADPSYPAYRNILMALGVEPVCLAAGPDNRFQPTVELLEAVPGRLDGLIVASPANPSGTMLGAAELGELTDYCRAHEIRLISDEIYHGITYAMPPTTALAFTDDAVVINSFSKYYSMTGWRIGWMVVPDDLHRSIECLKQNLFISAPTLSQHAAIAAFDCAEELDRNVARYAENRALLLRELPAAGFTRMAPADGAFYLYVDVSHLTNDSEAFCRRMLEETGVATSPGNDFDPRRGRSFMRISFAGPAGDIEESVTRLRSWTAKQG